VRFTASFALTSHTCWRSWLKTTRRPVPLSAGRGASAEPPEAPRVADSLVVTPVEVRGRAGNVSVASFSVAALLV
jgi:hypothetical protein